MRGIVVLVVAALVGCTQTPQEKAHDVCEAYCNCFEPGALPSTTTTCIEQECLGAVQIVSDACLDCVFAHDQVCSDLEQDCTDLCFPMDQTPDLGGMR